MSTNKIKTVATITEDIIDYRTGEITQSVETKVGQKEKEPAFVKLYIDDVSRLLDIPPSASKLLNILLKNMGYNNIIAMYKPIKEMICEDMNFELNTLNKAIKILHRKGLLIRKARGVYLVDPNQFGRGKWEDIKEIRMVIEYDKNGRKTINTRLQKQLKLEF